MTSAINEIIEAVAGWTPQYDTDVFVKAVYGESLKSFTGTPEMPVRIISQVSPDNSGANGFIALGKTMRADWTVSDLLLIRPVATGGDSGSLRTSEPQIRNYIKSYITQMQNDRSPTNQSWVEEISWNAGTFSYGDNVDYYGVNIVLSISEAISA